ncbi:glycerol-3-phosphate dehydrogenase [Sansalvadorimonas sp. 2012CJ34-2]|uniref:Glycerol-3-phosphate dehydrogenase n=1 Tax=Parendozoicomonas callyspongiae TaxID=2942213 RepID=A0ABT0PFQ9_9GAMM|nr:glycerol-3-phosphate dehydrogenase [Sansalvadorimonas sp. 2012CJ34-2]MCL6270214.1 glycerol-3-phosphate dehydrogenase [Sansalvadorimonas sp. 2012CJ34-2]
MQYKAGHTGNMDSHNHIDKYDLVIVGGGINGMGIARDAAGRSLKVLLCEQNDLASATSSASSKLIHGGLRYLEHYEFRLVREALKEREVLLSIAPHLVRPMRFRLPHAPHLRPAWMIRAGLFLYDTLAKRVTLPGSRGVHLNGQSPLQPSFTKAFEYSDCWVDDARLVIANALCAKNHGAVILPQTTCKSAVRNEEGWSVTLADAEQEFQITCKALVNAAGPWVSDFVESKLNEKPEYGIRMIKGSHIVVPALHSGEEAYILQNKDKRIVFVIPWQGQWSMVGTTDVEYIGDPSEVAPSDDEVAYLVDVVNSHFNKTIATKDIVYSFSGVRPLCNDESNDPSAITRDYTLTVSDESERFPLLNIFGGKLTTYRRLAESALAKLKPWFPDMSPSWTGLSPLPGGEISSQKEFASKLVSDKPWLPIEVAERYASSYGDLCYSFLNGREKLDDLGQSFGNGLYAAEVDYLITQEWASTPEDILWRRTKTGIGSTQSTSKELAEYIKTLKH